MDKLLTEKKVRANLWQVTLLCKQTGDEYISYFSSTDLEIYKIKCYLISKGIAEDKIEKLKTLIIQQAQDKWMSQ